MIIKTQALGSLAAVGLIVCLILLSAGCEPDAEQGDALALIRLPQQLPAELDHLVLQVSGPQMQTIDERVELNQDQEPLQIELSVPAGSQRRFVCQAFDVSEVLFYEGEQTRDVAAGAEIEVSIAMQPRAHAFGTIFQAGGGYPGAPLADYSFDGDAEHPAIETDGAGAYYLSLTPGEYELLVEHGAEQARAPLSLERAGQVLELDLYLAPIDHDGPVLFAAYPGRAALGQTIELYGEGFLPAGAPAPQAVFNDGHEVFSISSEYTDAALRVSVPAGLASGPLLLQVYQSMYEVAASRSNYIQFEIE